MKVLIPSYAAGSIIGKGGQTIVQLQKETGATIKLSKSKDFYPGRYPLSTVVLPVPGFAAGATQHDLFLVLRMQDNEFFGADKELANDFGHCHVVCLRMPQYSPDTCWLRVLLH